MCRPQEHHCRTGSVDLRAEALARAVDLADALCERLEAAGEDVTEERRTLAELAAVDMMNRRHKK